MLSYFLFQCYAIHVALNAKQKHTDCHYGIMSVCVLDTQSKQKLTMFFFSFCIKMKVIKYGNENLSYIFALHFGFPFAAQEHRQTDR